jgi:thiol-disulfide isomerase/thioredoxin
MSRTSSSTRPPRPRPDSAAGPNRVPLVIAGLIAALVVIALVVALLAGADADSGSDDTRTDGTGTGGSEAPSVEDGTALPPLPDSGTDPAAGQKLPELTGADANGDPMTITADGQPKMIVFLAHWCPHCQREVPLVQQWVDDGGLPDGVELVSVATAIDERRPNYPPQEWFEREGWTTPVLYDDAASTAALAAGLSSYPFFVAVDGQGNVVARISGELTTSQLGAIADELARPDDG